MAGDRFVQQTDEERGLIRAGADQLLRLLTALPGRRPLKRAQMPLLTERGFDLDRGRDQRRGSLQVAHIRGYRPVERPGGADPYRRIAL